MLFNSLIFLFLFLPVTLLVYYLSPQKLKNGSLLVASWIFYAWSGVSFSIILIGASLANYLCGLALGRVTTPASRKAWYIAGLLINLLPLVIFKYTNFFVANVNVLTGIFGWSEIILDTLILPLGISFFTFKAITYIVSVYRRETGVQRNFISLALYISVFPEVIAGPIDRYKNILPQFEHRPVSFRLFSSGIQRFTIGLGKKVLIANSLSVVADQIFNLPGGYLTTPVAWLGALCYFLQIYFDFSGYSDMAIGLGRMVGFTFMENFNFPYISRSIKEFWQRWHISFSTWLRDYLFLPIAYALSGRMKGNRYLGVRVDKMIYVMAVLITFLSCGIWHGAAWTFVIWGLIHGLFLMLEQIGLSRILKRLPVPFRQGYVIIILLMSWVIFRSDNLENAGYFMGVMLGFGHEPASAKDFLGYFNPGLILVLIIAIAGSTRIFERIYCWLKTQLAVSRQLSSYGLSHVFQLTSILLVISILVLSTLYILADTHHSFIYFNF